ncbi:hypothetical protein C7M84_001206 [Penaeus vannamei]|uniref:Uncharacterized protein n=1 Tax=Penaeus vannamei TaxID=6689 RepID=A0A423TU95_PENVA|nr:hypothetical protein C7M84_001206 [Penaeus vannamei]
MNTDDRAPVASQRTFLTPRSLSSRLVAVTGGTGRGLLSPARGASGRLHRLQCVYCGRAVASGLSLSDYWSLRPWSPFSTFLCGASRLRSLLASRSLVARLPTLNLLLLHLYASLSALLTAPRAGSASVGVLGVGVAVWCGVGSGRAEGGLGFLAVWRAGERSSLCSCVSGGCSSGGALQASTRPEIPFTHGSSLLPSSHLLPLPPSSPYSDSAPSPPPHPYTPQRERQLLNPGREGRAGEGQQGSWYYGSLSSLLYHFNSYRLLSCHLLCLTRLLTPIVSLYTLMLSLSLLLSFSPCPAPSPSARIIPSHFRFNRLCPICHSAPGFLYSSLSSPTHSLLLFDLSLSHSLFLSYHLSLSLSHFSFLTLSLSSSHLICIFLYYPILFYARALPTPLALFDYSRPARRRHGQAPAPRYGEQEKNVHGLGHMRQQQTNYDSWLDIFRERDSLPSPAARPRERVCSRAASSVEVCAERIGTRDTQ